MKISLFWHRRDLRFEDNAGLAAALQAEEPVLPLFIYDKTILDKLEPEDARLTFIFDQVERLADEAHAAGGGFVARYGKVSDVFRQLLKDYEVAAVYTNEDYEPYATERDAAVAELLQKHGAELRSFKDQVIFAKDEVLTKNGKPHKVFGAYSKTWQAQMKPEDFKPHPSARLLTKENLAQPVVADKARPTLQKMGFKRHEQYTVPAKLPPPAVVKDYDKTRDTPALERGTTRMSVHLRFGTVSIRSLMQQADKLNEKLLNEMIWRDFFMMLLWHFPNTATEAYDPKMRHLPYRDAPREYKAWCEGRTGQPFVDAGMRQLNQTGYIHNRARIVAAGYLVKHLFIDWTLGEHYFSEKLLDYDMSNNVGNWQWMAGTGAVAAPWFRVYNPEAQQKQYDPDLAYIKKWVPEYGTDKYPKPLVDLKEGRDRAIEAIRKGRK
ncbi:cryptochrome/photolyase family protein [Hymenobacter psychrotolerans]|uniref:Deoxyribodipyrimidine photo-lyase n=1 Tax=Hymenobacter psychrotolerans DSM 18569 TaxID=1121959 RepID=A0A1M6Y4T5_9BACT|nr:deoxyribodipyrimidine photo-lyase [Hymenobacter psychrotolerans]SHL13153.1 deoxyribodipyrimidine photo-lyase [Hymenobacter psychrotolerans DSM 18569]